MLVTFEKRIQELAQDTERCIRHGLLPQGKLDASVKVLVLVIVAGKADQVQTRKGPEHYIKELKLSSKGSMFPPNKSFLYSLHCFAISISQNNNQIVFFKLIPL